MSWTSEWSNGIIIRSHIYLESYYPSYLLLGRSLPDNCGLFGGSNCLGFWGSSLLGRKLVGSLDLYENASLDAALESGLQNMLLDGNLTTTTENAVREE